MKKFYIKSITLIALLVTTIADAQDIHFSQFAETPLYRNPALAGIVTGDIRVQVLYRTQWNSVANAYKTGSLNAEYKMPVGRGDDYMTVGLLAFYDRAGTTSLTTTHIMPALNFHKSLSTEKNMYLSAGFMGGYVQRRLDISKITTNNQYDGMGDGENLSLSQYAYLDGSAGISFNSGIGDNPNDNFVIGLAYHHFNRPQSSFFNNADVRISPKIVGSADVKFDVNEYSSLLIQTNYAKQGKYTETIAGFMYGLKFGALVDNPDYLIQGGAYLRWNDALIPMVKLDYRPFAVGLSYDVNISKLKTSSYGRGGFELSITYIGLLDKYKSTLNATRCPRF
ncbi:MAG: PorP/SprF family type IX secretion system membrane protein [Chitinophagaceae bacterium]